MRTTKQRMTALDAAIAQIWAESENSPHDQMVKIIELLQRYRSWEDAPPDGDDAFLTVHDDLNAQFAELLSRTGDPGISAKVLDVAVEVALLEDSVPWERGISARLVASARRELSVSTWAERIAALPPGALRDFVAYQLDVVHVVLGDHHGGEECATMVAAFSEEETVTTRIIGPTYRWLMPYITRL